MSCVEGPMVPVVFLVDGRSWLAVFSALFNRNRRRQPRIVASTARLEFSVLFELPNADQDDIRQAVAARPFPGRPDRRNLLPSLHRMSPDSVGSFKSGTLSSEAFLYFPGRAAPPHRA